MRRRVQLIFQDPIASLNPRRRIGDIIAEPLVISGVKDPKKREQLVHEVGAVGLDPQLVIGRLPHEFSGGQCQRICIARAWCSTRNSSSAMNRRRRSRRPPAAGFAPAARAPISVVATRCRNFARSPRINSPPAIIH